MMSIYLLELRNIRRSAGLATMVVSLILTLMLAFYPSMQTDSMRALAGAKLQSINPAVLAALGITQIMDFSVISIFFGYILQFVALMIMAVVTQQAVALLIKEETDGTIEYLCARPVSRTGIFWGKWMAHLTTLALMMLCFAAVTAAGYVAFGQCAPGAALREALLLFGAILFVALVFSALGVLLSAWVRSSRGAATLTMALVFGSFLCGMLSTLIPSLEPLIWLSPLNWIRAQKLLSEGISAKEWAAGLGAIVASAGCAWARYCRKDLLI